MKKLFVLLLCLVAVLAIVSCTQNPKTEPKTEPDPSSGDAYYYRLTATLEAKRFSFKYSGGVNGINPKEGDTITFKYRSSHPVTHLYLRNESGSNQTAVFAKKAAIDEYVEEYDDEWLSFSFTYPEMEDTYPVSGFLLELANYTDGSHDAGKGMFAVGDYLDIMDFCFNETVLTIEQESAITTGNHGIWNNDNGDQTLPTLELKYL